MIFNSQSIESPFDVPLMEILKYCHVFYRINSLNSVARIDLVIIMPNAWLSGGATDPDREAPHAFPASPLQPEVRAAFRHNDAPSSRDMRPTNQWPRSKHRVDLCPYMGRLSSYSGTTSARRVLTTAHHS